MIKKVAASLLATCVLGGGLAVAAVVPAQAAGTTQKICSSKYSTTDFKVVPDSSAYPVAYVDAGACYPYLLPKGGSTIYLGRSYRVGYGGDYSACRTNTGFTPYTKADNVYFKTYSGTSC